MKKFNSVCLKKIINDDGEIKTADKASISIIKEKLLVHDAGKEIVVVDDDCYWSCCRSCCCIIILLLLFSIIIIIISITISIHTKRTY